MEFELLLSAWLMPTLFALLDLTALALALIYYRRSPAACGLVISASLFGLAAAVLRGLFVFLGDHGPGSSLLLLFLGGLSWIGYGLMIVAVFTAMRPPPESREHSMMPKDDEDDWGAPTPTKIAPVETGIRNGK